MTFDECYANLSENCERVHGYALRILDDDGSSALFTVARELNSTRRDLKDAHEMEVAEAKADTMPLVTYDVAGNARHKAACALRELGDEQLEEKSLHESMRAFYEALNNECPSEEVPVSCVLKTIRDRLIELLES